MKHIRTILVLSVISLHASSCEYYEVWATDVSPEIVDPEPEPPVVDPEPEPPVVDPDPEPPVVDPEPEPPTDCQFEFNESELVVKLCTGADIEKLRSIMEQYNTGLTIYFMQDINLADGHQITNKNGTCMIADWESLPPLYESEILTPDDKQIKISLTTNKTACALPKALFEEIEYSTIKNLWLNYDLNSEGMDSSAAFLIHSRSNRFENITFSGNIVHHFTPEPNTAYLNIVAGIVASDYSLGNDPHSQFIATVCQDATFDVYNMAYTGCVLGFADFDFELSTWPKTNHVKSMKCESEFGCSLGGLVGFFTSGTIKNSSNIVDEISGDEWIGGLVACSQHATIENVINQVGSISDQENSLDSDIGGIAGFVLNSKIHNIDNSVNSIQINGKYANVGGAFGKIEYAGDMENIITKAKITFDNNKYSHIAGFASYITSYSPTRFVNISSILETAGDTHGYNMFANDIRYDYSEMVDGAPFNPSIEFSNIACTGTLDIITDNNPNVIDSSELGPDKITVNNFWFEVPDIELLPPDAGYPAFPNPGLYRRFTPYHQSTIDNALMALNANATVEWKIDSDTIDNTKTEILTFDAVQEP